MVRDAASSSSRPSPPPRKAAGEAAGELLRSDQPSQAAAGKAAFVNPQGALVAPQSPGEGRKVMQYPRPISPSAFLGSSRSPSPARASRSDRSRSQSPADVAWLSNCAQRNSGPCGSRRAAGNWRGVKECRKQMRHDAQKQTFEGAILTKSENPSQPEADETDESHELDESDEFREVVRRLLLFVWQATLPDESEKGDKARAEFLVGKPTF
eukprot:Skav223076  [mRNA]  locus=scaffold419:186118:187584:+ [translate_table: standard]